MILSFIIPMYNAEQYIEQCLYSIIEQPINKNTFEIILINDGSTDNSLSKANEISKKHKNITVYDQENIGLSATRNRGIELAKGEYIWFIDADDYIIHNTVNSLLECLKNHNLDILEFQYIRTESRILNVSRHNKPSFTDIKVLNGKKYVATGGYNESCCISIYRRQLILEIGLKFIEGRVMEDMVFNAEIVPKANRIAYFPLDAYRYVINPNSIWTNKESNAHRKSITDFIFMTKKISGFIKTYKQNGIGTKIIESKQQEMLFNISKRLLTSDFTISEINIMIGDLYKYKLYPLKKYKGISRLRKLETCIFNRKLLFLLSIRIYRFFKKPIDHFIIRKYRQKREKLIKETTVNI
ncbi:glycosyltransferase [Aureibaculum algae]|uniref:Glycosyltransferase n=1 Tax=Aureibaculum algae TaxID=2584122 RepID=A0A5B7TV39_9FLAO|nr:glycosyltransferase [Aureibaculum algae]QCX39143.1 glycosyltransferase [Aureibaculum algae]